MAGLLKKPLKLALVQLAAGTLVGIPPYNRVSATYLNGRADTKVSPQVPINLQT